jgi:hypothetical protein
MAWLTLFINGSGHGISHDAPNSPSSTWLEELEIQAETVEIYYKLWPLNFTGRAIN